MAQVFTRLMEMTRTGRFDIAGFRAQTKMRLRKTAAPPQKVQDAEERRELTGVRRRVEREGAERQFNGFEPRSEFRRKLDFWLTQLAALFRGIAALDRALSSEYARVQNLYEEDGNLKPRREGALQDAVDKIAAWAAQREQILAYGWELYKTAVYGTVWRAQSQALANPDKEDEINSARDAALTALREFWNTNTNSNGTDKRTVLEAANEMFPGRTPTAAADEPTDADLAKASGDPRLLISEDDLKKLADRLNDHLEGFGWGRPIDHFAFLPENVEWLTEASPELLPTLALVLTDDGRQRLTGRADEQRATTGEDVSIRYPTIGKVEDADEGFYVGRDRASSQFLNLFFTLDEEDKPFLPLFPGMPYVVAIFWLPMGEVPAQKIGLKVGSEEDEEAGREHSTLPPGTQTDDEILAQAQKTLATLGAAVVAAPPPAVVAPRPVVRREAVAAQLAVTPTQTAIQEGRERGVTAII